MHANLTDSNLCNILISKNYSHIIGVGHGWEGIPDGFIINISLCTSLLIAFALIRWRVDKSKNEFSDDIQKSDWLHFIYGDKKPKPIAPIKSELINRRHPLAYLPPVLHEYESLITDKLVDYKAYSPCNTSDANKALDQVNEDMLKKPENNEFNEKIYDSSKTIEWEAVTEESTLISIEDQEFTKTDEHPSNDEDKQIAHLKSILSIDTELKGDTTDNNEQKQIIDTETKRCWLLNYLMIKDEDILKNKGSDALQYLLFQRYIIYFLTALTFICLTIILPINTQGSFEADHKLFGKTTINNLEAESNLLWIHTMITSIVVSMGIYVMFHFSKVISVDKKRVDKRILLIERIPENKRNTSALVEYFNKNFPKVVIKRITFIYDIIQLEWYKKSLLTAIEAKSYSLEYKKRYNQRCEVRPYCLGRFGGVFGCCSCCPKIDGMLFYAEEKAELEKEIKSEIKHVLSKPKGSAFVMFEKRSMADEVYTFFKSKQYLCCNSWFRWIIRIFRSNHSDPLETYQWRVYHAPYPEDIEWADIGLDNGRAWLWNIGMHALLLLIFLFLSTPAVAVKFIETTLSLQQHERYRTSLLKYFSPLLLMMMTIVLPSLVMLAQNLIPYRTKSALNHAMMCKVFIFYLLMVLILPSLGLMSTEVLIESLVSTNETHSFRWNCLFPSESSAFFVNYVLQSAFLSNTFEIMRFPEVGLYLLYTLVISRSVAEYESARQKITFSFSFGSKYPRFLLVFTIVVTYSIACPLIAPCGLFYMVVKHLVDRYLIYYVYNPSKINCRIHSTAVQYVNIALFFQLLQVSAFLTIRHQSSAAQLLQAFSLIFLLFLIYRCCTSCADNDE